MLTMKKGCYKIVVSSINRFGFEMQAAFLIKDNLVIDSIRCLFSKTIDRWVKEKELLVEELIEQEKEQDIYDIKNKTAPQN